MARGPGPRAICQTYKREVTASDAALEALGHPVRIVEKVAGGMNGVLVDAEGWRHGAACW